MAVIYGDHVWWYCDICRDEGEADSQSGAERQADQHECVPGEAGA